MIDQLLLQVSSVATANDEIAVIRYLLQHSAELFADAPTTTASGSALEHVSHLALLIHSYLDCHVTPAAVQQARLDSWSNCVKWHKPVITLCLKKRPNFETV